MKMTTDWLKDHLDTKLNENQIIDKLTDIGLEVESVDSQSNNLHSFISRRCFVLFIFIFLYVLYFYTFDTFHGPKKGPYTYV